MRVLVAGINVRHIACSASRAGHDVHALDAYCDLDLEACVSQSRVLDRPGRLREAAEAVLAYAGEVDPDAVVLGPGLEEAGIEGYRVLNNPPEKAALVSDKLWIARWLEEKGFPFIPTRKLEEGASFPAIIKPRRGAGGVGCILAPGPVQIEGGENITGDMIVQDWVEGLPASASVIGTGREAVALSTNEQIIGADWAGAEGFRYTGNITPIEPPVPGIAEMAEEIVAELGLKGSNGVDFIVSEKGPVVVEVNPRFQGSLDAVEISTGCNVFQAHALSFDGILPERPIPICSGGRAIVYALEDTDVRERLNSDWLADVPRPGTRIKKGEPLASVLAAGRSREEALGLLIRRAESLRLTLEPSPP